VNGLERSLVLMVLPILVAGAETPDEATLRQRLPEIFGRASAHYKALDAAATERAATETAKDGSPVFPHGFRRDEGKLDMRSIFWWTSGHYAGSLWYLYEATGDAALKDRALFWTERVAPNSTADTNHDLGFIMFCSYGNARRLQKTDQYDALLMETASTLARRFHGGLGLIRSWGRVDSKDDFLVIPDNLMNLELLEWAGTMDSRFKKIARSHADVTMRRHFRPDGGCYHVLDYDQKTKRIKTIKAGQGASCETAWSRGQSWGIYGYAMMYRMSGDVRYLDFARKLADYAMDHPNMPSDCIPYWDFGAPGEERDSSAGAIMASALLEIAHHVGDAEGGLYRAFAVRQLLSLTSPEYFSKGDEIGHFLLKHGTGHRPNGREIDTPLCYGDYYFLEALLRFRRCCGDKPRRGEVKTTEKR